jgi:SEC-C motif-containing protein
MPRRRKTGLCPCGSKKPYPLCCGRYVDGDEVPPTPEVLMRSRYTAYAHGDVDYIIETTDSEGAAWESDEARWRESIAEFSRGCRFGGVVIHEADDEGDVGTVKFTARLKRGKTDASFTEVSHFVRRDGRWYYTEGTVR